jgi:hypothetical protein
MFELGAPQIAVAQPTCDATADALVAARPQRREVLFRNAGAVDCYVGNSDVTTATGLLLAAGESLTLAVTCAVYGVTASGTATVHVLETYQ